MALNLWKIGGQPTSFNPLPSGAVNYVFVNAKDLIVRFYAKSNPSINNGVAKLKIRDSNAANIVYCDLTPVRTFYEVPISKHANANSIYLVDEMSLNNIIIDSIELVQKPLPKLTINGIDGFQSGKWTLHANAQAVDDETLV
jgi:hypothetical protein